MEPTVDSVAAFDLQFQDYSLMESLAWAGIDAFAVNLIGWGGVADGLDEVKAAFRAAGERPLSERCSI